MDYGDMLDRAYEKMPKMEFEQKRFDVPKARVSVEGNKTIFTNFKDIADYVNRKPSHIVKFLGKELGAASRMEGPRLVFVGKYRGRSIDEKLEKYVRTFVICPVCGKPDTELTRVDRVPVLKCMACGAKKSVQL